MTLAAYQVWTMNLGTGGVPTWDDTQWVLQTRLVPRTADVNYTYTGKCVFELLRATRADTASGGYFTDSFFPTRGQYVAVTDATCTTPGVNGILYWVGVFGDYLAEKLFDSDDAIGTVEGLGIGTVLDQVPLTGLHRYDASVSAGVPLLGCPTFNTDGLAAGQIVGNMKTGGDGNPQFDASVTLGSGTLWDRWSMLQHAFAYVATASAKLPPLTLNATAAVQTLLQTAIAEVIPTNGLTLKGLLDYLCGAARGLAWFPSVLGSSWEIEVYSATDVAVGAIPAAIFDNATLTGAEARVTFSSGAWDDFDAVQVDGAPVVCCGTIDAPDGTLYSGWSPAAASAFASPLPTIVTSNINKYSAEQLQAMAESIRNTGLVADVYVRYIIVSDVSGLIKCKAFSGAGGGSWAAQQPLCPLLDWSGTALTVDATATAQPVGTEMRLQPKIPWFQGVSASGTDYRNNYGNFAPQLCDMPVFVYEPSNYYDSSAQFPVKWLDLRNPQVVHFSEVPSISVEDRGPGIRIRYTHPQTLSPTVVSQGFWDTFDPDNINTPALNWQQLFATVAVQSDQRVRVINYRTGFSASSVRNTLRVDRPDLQCWLVRAHTFVGATIDSGGNYIPDEVASDTFTRNDWPLAQKLADELAAFIFRKRTGVQVTLASFSLPSWGELGTMVGTLTESDGVTTWTLNTLVTNIHYDFNPRAPRMTITTSDPPMPANLGLVPMQRPMGGPVSVALGGTPIAAQAKTERLATELRSRVGGLGTPGRQRKPGGIYGTPLWDWTGGTEASQVVLTDINGNPIGSSPGYLDSANSLLPVGMGNGAIYELQYVGLTARSGTTKRTYRAVRYVVGGTIPDSATAFGVGTGVAKLYSSGAAINTTVAGVPKQNIIPIAVASGAVPTNGFSFGLSTPLQQYPYSSVPKLLTQAAAASPRNTADATLSALVTGTYQYTVGAATHVVTFSVSITVSGKGDGTYPVSGSGIVWQSSDQSYAGGYASAVPSTANGSSAVALSASSAVIVTFPDGTTLSARVSFGTIILVTCSATTNNIAVKNQAGN